MEISATDIARALLDSGAVALQPRQPFRLASGILAPLYCDNRLLIGDVARRRLIARAIAAGVGGLPRLPGLVAGTATAGIAWAAWVADLLELPMAYVRSGAKAHGTGRQIEGGATPGQQALLIEDTITTGGSSLAAAAVLREAGMALDDCWCIYSHQMPEALAGFASAGIRLHPLTTLPVLLEVAVAEQRLSAEGRATIEAWAADPRGWQPAP